MASKKLKKALKMLGAGAAIAGLGKAFMNNRARKAMLNSADANDGFLNSMIGKTGSNKMMNANELGFDLSEYDRSQPFGFGIMAKKGGRIVKGKKAAVRRKANRSKKK
tara:strand:+ start:73 stop:396 length:324 start_codon:yes stop_codon:yes gene_type:complete